jgi:hypothetical protein
VLALALAALNLIGCEWLSSLVPAPTTSTDQVQILWGENPQRDPQRYEPELRGQSNPKHDTTFEFRVASNEALDLGGDSPDLAINVVLTSWGSLRKVHPITLQRVPYTPTQEEITHAQFLGEPLLDKRYTGTLTAACPECVGEAGQAMPAVWQVTAQHTSVTGIQINANYTCTYVEYNGPFLSN